MKKLIALHRAPGTVTLVVFALACLLGFLLLWGKSGGTIPGVTGAQEHRYTFVTEDAKNLIFNGKVRIAGVDVGRVESTEAVDGGARVEISVDDEAGPLHEGAVIRVGVKALVGSSYVDVVDGDGDEMPSGTTIAAKNVVDAVDVDELYETLDDPTRESLKSALQSLDKGVKGRGQDLDVTLTGLGEIAHSGESVLNALAVQSGDLEQLTVEVRRLLESLDTGRGLIADVVTDARTLTAATAQKSEQVKETVRVLPGLVQALEPAGTSLEDLSGSLSPVAADLRQAAPDLNVALLQLPAISKDLDGLVPDLDKTLDRVPSTLERVPAFDATIRDIVPTAELTLRDVDPMLAYLEPYGLDVGALFASFGASFDTRTEDGVMPIRLGASAEGLGTLRNNPVPLQGLLGQLGYPNWTNPYPAPLTADRPTPWTGPAPEVDRAPK